MSKKLSLKSKIKKLKNIQLNKLRMLNKPINKNKLLKLLLKLHNTLQKLKRLKKNHIPLIKIGNQANKNTKIGKREIKNIGKREEKNTGKTIEMKTNQFVLPKRMLKYKLNNKKSLLKSQLKNTGKMVNTNIKIGKKEERKTGTIKETKENILMPPKNMLKMPNKKSKINKTNFLFRLQLKPTRKKERENIKIGKKEERKTGTTKENKESNKILQKILKTLNNKLSIKNKKLLLKPNLKKSPKLLKTMKELNKKKEAGKREERRTGTRRELRTINNKLMKNNQTMMMKMMKKKKRSTVKKVNNLHSDTELIFNILKFIFEFSYRNETQNTVILT